MARLALQHGVWRARASAARRRAGFTAGHPLLDVGCGPGLASLDLARLAGPAGRVTAIDCSRRFLDLLARAARAEGLDNITVAEGDLDHEPLPTVNVDGAGSRSSPDSSRTDRWPLNQRHETKMRGSDALPPP